MRLSAYAYDVGPAKNLAMVACEAAQRNHRVASVGNDEPGTKDLLCPPPDVLITGLSSQRNADELDIGRRATEMGIPWVVLADTHRSWGRESAKGRVENAHLVAASPLEIEEAREFGYRNAVYLGGPPLWQGFTDKTSAEITGHNPGSRIVLVVGSKDAGITDRMCSRVVAACKEVFGDKWELIFKPHPNEGGKFPGQMSYRDSYLSGVRLPTTQANTTDLIEHVDLTVCIPGATDSIAAAHKLKPAICFEEEASLAQLERITGSRSWFPTDAGACVRATAETVRDEIRGLLLDPQSRDELRTQQALVYPAHATEKRVEASIVDYLEGLARR